MQPVDNIAKSLAMGFFSRWALQPPRNIPNEFERIGRDIVSDTLKKNPAFGEIDRIASEILDYKFSVILHRCGAEIDELVRFHDWTKRCFLICSPR